MGLNETHACGAVAVKAELTLIEELEFAMANAQITQCANVLRRIADLFAAGSAAYSAPQVALFDEVMCLLLQEIETSARATLGERLAGLNRTPPRLMRELAFDDAIEVAGPVLTRSADIDDSTLVENARTKSQEHLLAIAHRQSLGEAVTDVLVERGDQSVVISTAANAGAKLSEFGYLTLVRRSENNEDLAMRLWLRHDVPRQHLLTLFADASEAVRCQMQSGDRRNAKLVKDLIAAASNEIQTRSRDISAQYAAARERVVALHRAGRLTEAWIYQFAATAKFDETTIALSLVSDLPIGVIERVMVREGTEQLVILAKAAAFSWQTTKAILMTAAGEAGMSAHDLARCLANFDKLKPETAEKAIRFFRLRERAAKAF